jgi:hypothetical protein
MMRINQFHCSFGIGFRDAVTQSYGLVHKDIPNPMEPLLIVGVYNFQHFGIIRNMHNLVVVYWGGSDSEFLVKYGYDSFWAIMFRKKLNIHHIASSRWIADDLKLLGIPNIHEIPVLLRKHDDLSPCPLGDSIYMYMPDSKVYNGGIYSLLKNRLPYNFIETNPATFDRAGLIDAYKRSFIGLRFTKHDGLSETVCEMGLMGRHMIHNGDVPNCVKYDPDDIDRIIWYIDNVYTHRERWMSYVVSQDVTAYIHSSEDWLDTEFYLSNIPA